MHEHFRDCRFVAVLQAGLNSGVELLCSCFRPQSNTPEKERLGEPTERRTRFTPPLPDFDVFNSFGGVQAAALREDACSSLATRLNRPGSHEAFANLIAVHTLPAGGEGISVRIMRQPSTNQLIVVKSLKIVNSHTDATGYSLPEEARTIKEKLGRHPNVISLFDYRAVYSQKHGMLCELSMPYCDLGDLGSFVDRWSSIKRRTKQDIPTIFVFHCAASLTSALAFLHEGIFTDPATGKEFLTGRPALLHRDIKPVYIFLRRPAKPAAHGVPDIVLGDFGLACYEHQSRGWCGTSGYLPPEAVAVRKLKDDNPKLYRKKSEKCVLTMASDVYCFGAVLWELATLEPFDNTCPAYTKQKIDLAISKSRYEDRF